MAIGSIRIEGGKQLERRLKALPPRVAGQVSRQALRAGAKIVQAAAVADAPVRKGLLKQSIKVRAAKRRRGSVGVVVQTGQGFFRGETFYGAFQELGFHLGPRRLGNLRRFVEGKHFMKRAFDDTREEAAKVTTDQLWAGIRRAATRG